VEELAPFLLRGWTPGGVGIWVLVAAFLGAWWKGLPAVLDAFANRQSKIEERMGKLLEDATARFTREIAAADKRHDDCMEGQQRLLVRIDTLEDKVSEQQECIERQQATIEGLRRQAVQNSVSALRVDGQVASPVIEAALQSLDKIKGVAE
jgi:predicted  nucleic acid-binding Zn-ribbon protein